MQPLVRDDFLSDFCAVQETIRAGVVPSRATKAANTWKLWLAFCREHNINPWFLSNFDPLPFLQVFGQRYRQGRFSPCNQPVRAGTVADSIRMMGQTYRQLGTRDFRLDKFTGQFDFRLQRQLKAFEKNDPTPTRVKPVPLQLLQHIVTTAHKSTHTSDANKAIADKACLAFFHLLRPGEYTYQKNNAPFRLQDVSLYTGQR
jgi:hypothetical protein